VALEPKGGVTTCRKIHIYGGPGSGKSYVAGELSQTLGIPVFDLDDIFWDNADDGYNTRASEQERDAGLAAILERDAWIIEGVYHQWLRQSFQEADIILELDTPLWIRDWRIVRRFMRCKLGLLPSRKRETFTGQLSLLKWNHGYRDDNQRRTRAFIAELGRETVRCTSMKDVMAALDLT
jgi:adenylate kinase family enzyme